MTTIAARNFSVGTVLSQAISVFVANLVPFVVLALVLLLPSLIYGLAVLADPTAGYSAGTFIAVIIQMVLTQLTTAAITFGTVQYLRGQPVGVGEGLARGLSLILPVIGVAILAGLIIGIGTVLLVVPGVIAAVMLWVAIPAAVIERPGVVASLKRSADLTKGFRWSVFGILVIIVVAGIVIGLILQFIVLSAAGFTAYSIVNWVIQAVFTAFSATAAAVGYYFLRVAKEGADIADIAKVFD
jgi:hypothetical protein